MCVSVISCVSECVGLRLPSSADFMDLCHHTGDLNSGISAMCIYVTVTERSPGNLDSSFHLRNSR